MKRILLSVFITVFAVIFSISTNNYLKTQTLMIESELFKCSELISDEALSDALEKSKIIKENWNNKKSAISLFINGEDWKALDRELERLTEFLADENTSSSSECIGECINLLLSIKEKEKLTFDGVF